MNDTFKVLLSVLTLLGVSVFVARASLNRVLPGVKPGANIDTLRPEMNDAVIAAGTAATELGIPNVITSGNDSVHMAGSLHFEDLAIDVRRGDWPDFNDVATARKQTTRIKEQLSRDFDVVLENTHIHIEYDPKRTVA